MISFFQIILISSIRLNSNSSNWKDLLLWVNFFWKRFCLKDYSSRSLIQNSFRKVLHVNCFLNGRTNQKLNDLYRCTALEQTRCFISSLSLSTNIICVFSKSPLYIYIAYTIPPHIRTFCTSLFFLSPFVCTTLGFGSVTGDFLK